MLRALTPILGLALGSAVLVPADAATDLGNTMFSKTVSVTGLHKLRVDGEAVITLVKGTTETLAVKVPERQRKEIRIEIDEDGLLRIRTRMEHGWWGHLFGTPHKTPRFTLTYVNLDSIELTGTVKLQSEELRTPHLDISVSGAATLDVRGVDTDTLRIDGSGAVKARLAGRATSQHIVISGAGTYDCPMLASDDARVQVAGAGKVIVRTAKTLDVNISGAGRVDYIGDPQVTQHISGAGRVQRQSAGASSPPIGRPQSLTEAIRLREWCRA